MDGGKEWAHQSTEGAAVEFRTAVGRGAWVGGVGTIWQTATPRSWVFNTLADFRKGHPSLSTTWPLIWRELIYILNGLSGLPLRVAIVIFIYIQLINGVAAHNGTYSIFCLKVDSKDSQ